MKFIIHLLIQYLLIYLDYHNLHIPLYVFYIIIYLEINIFSFTLNYILYFHIYIKLENNHITLKLVFNV